MRTDGRQTDQLRPVKLELGYTRYAEGSVLITQGNTVALDLAAGGIGTLLAAQQKMLAEA